MRRLSELVPGHTDRAFIVGQTGSGKTLLAEFLLRYRHNVVVFDPKRRIKWDGYTIVNSLRAATKTKGKIVYRPNHHAIKYWNAGDDEVKRAFEWVYLRGDTTLYVDEAYLLTDGEQMPDFYHACLTQGRELGIETWTATQRPMHVPQVVMSEAEHLYAFRMRMAQDRKKVEAMCGLESRYMEGLPKYYFYYASQDGDPVGPLTLDLSSAPK